MNVFLQDYFFRSEWDSKPLYKVFLWLLIGNILLSIVTWLCAYNVYKSTDLTELQTMFGITLFLSIFLFSCLSDSVATTFIIYRRYKKSKIGGVKLGA